MTKNQWYATNNPQVLLHAVFKEASPRKLRLAACACCRHIWHLLRDPRLYEGLDVAERYVDDLVTRAELQTAHAAVMNVGNAGQPVSGDYDHLMSAYSPSSAVMMATQPKPSPHEAAYWAASAAEAEAYFCNGTSRDQLDDILAEEQRWHSLFIRDLFGDAFCTAPVRKHWLRWQDGTVVKLARAAYDERQLPGGQLEAVRLALVADALEEAGCTNDDLLLHLRGPGPHVRGCWALDLLLDKQ